MAFLHVHSEFRCESCMVELTFIQFVRPSIAKNADYIFSSRPLLGLVAEADRILRVRLGDTAVESLVTQALHL